MIRHLNIAYQTLCIHVYKTITLNLLKNFFNSYKPGVPFMGHMQTE